MRMRTAGIVFLTALLVGAAFQGSRGLFESTEGRYALCAREMSDSGRWCEPTLLEQPHWTKPPLAYWTMIAGIRLFGRNAWGARAFNVVAFALTAVLVAGIAGAMLDDPRAALAAGVIYATSPYPAGIAASLNTDTVLALWEALAVYCFWRMRRAAGPRKEGLWNAAFWVALGLAFMTKGPPGLAPLVPVIIYHLIACRRGGACPPVFRLSGVLLFLVVGGWWYVWVSWRHPGLLSYFLGQEVVARVATDRFHRNPEWYRPFTMYLPCLLLGGGFWSWYLWKELSRKRVWTRAFWTDLLRRAEPPLFLAAWLVPPLLIFSVSRSRMLTYVLPLFVPLTLVMARTVVRTWPGTAMPRPPTRFLATAVASAVLIIVGKGIAGHLPPRREDMGRLYNLCKAFDGSDTAIVLFEERRQLGLNFYARGRVFRCRTRKARGVVRDADALVRELTDQRAPWRTIVFICRRDRNRENMLRFIRDHGLSPSELREDPNWTVAVVKVK